jgi:ABC-type glycerol-3-phosphate transport system substrate-binding protein
MRMQKKGRIVKLALVLCLMALMASVVAISATTLSAAPRKSAEKVVLNFWDMQWGNGTNYQKVVQENIDLFQAEYPNIEVHFTQMTWGDYYQKLMSAVEAGTPPDIGGADSGWPFVMAAQGHAMDIGSLYRKWQKQGLLKDMPAWAVNKWIYKGHHIAVTWQYDARDIYYRKDLFKAAHIKVPTTWAQLLAAAKKLNHKGVAGIAIPGKQGSYDTDQFYMGLVFQAGGQLTDAKGRPAINTPQQLAALNFEKKLAGYAPAGTPDYAFNETQRAYTQGEAAMASGGGWFIGSILSSTNKAVAQNPGVLPVMIGPGGKKAQHSIAFANAWMIYKTTHHPTAAKTFLDWMMQKKNISHLYEAGGIWPVYKSLLNKPIFHANRMSAAFADHVLKYGVDYPYPDNKAALGIGSIGTTLADVVINPVLTGTKSPQQALKDEQKKLEKSGTFHK